MAEIDRYYAYQSLFTGRTAVPKSEILKKLEISSATFKRDLAMFRDRLNTPISYERDLGGYKLENPEGLQQLPGMLFSQEEALALMTIQTMIGQLEPGLFVQHESIFKPGEPSELIYIVRKGGLYIDTETYGRDELGRGEIVGEVSFLGGPRIPRHVLPQMMWSC